MKKTLVFIPSLFLLSINALAPVISDIAAAFPDMPASTIQLVVSLPSIVAILSILLAGRLSFLIPKKTIVFFSLCCMLLGGILPFFNNRTIWHLLAWGVLYGLGLGGISPLSTDLIKEAYPPAQHGSVMGVQAAIAGVGGMLFSFLGSRLSVINWNYAYIAYLLIVPALLCVAILPANVPKKGEKKPVLGTISHLMLFYVLSGFFLGTFTYAFQTNVSLFIIQKSLGNVGTAGSLVTMFSASSILGGLLTGRCIKVCRSFTQALCMGVYAIGLLLLQKSSSLQEAGIAACVTGLAFSLRMPSGYLQVTRITPEENSTMAITFFCCSVQAGNCLSPFLLRFLDWIIRGTGKAEEKLLIAGLSLALMCLISVAVEVCLQRKQNSLKT